MLNDHKRPDNINFMPEKYVKAIYGHHMIWSPPAKKKKIK